MKQVEKALRRPITGILISIVMGFIVGAVVLPIAGYNPAAAYASMISGIFSKPKYLVQVIIRATPLILTGLSISFAFKTGMFNIGAEGQAIMGMVAAVVVGYCIELPPLLHFIAVALSAIAVAGLWGALVGVLKAKFGIHEVISGIMLNWIALYLTNLILTTVKHPNSPYTKSLTAANPSALIPSLGLSKLFAGEKTVTIAIPLAILMAVLVWVILNKTKFGYELKATGFNFNAAKYCGMKENRNVILTMVIAGGLAGMGAGLYYLTGIEDWETTISSVPGMGFNGIAVAFLGGLSPFGSILASFFIQHITTGGGNVDLTVYSPQISSLISSLIIFLCAFSGFLKERLQASLRKGDERRAARAKLAEEQKGGAQK